MRPIAFVFALLLAAPAAAADWKQYEYPDFGVFKLTIAEVGDGGPDENDLVSHAVKTMTEGSVIKLDIPHRIRSSYGRQFGLAGENGGYSYGAVFLYKKRLYQIEGKAFVAGGEAEIDAMIFQQSLDFT